MIFTNEEKVILVDAVGCLVNLKGEINHKVFNLIEKLASTIGDAIITSFNTESVVVRVRKPQAQMSGPLDTVEVELKVER